MSIGISSIAARMAYLGEDVKTAATQVIIKNLKPHNIGAGLVAVGADGSIAAPYNRRHVPRLGHRRAGSPRRIPRRGPANTTRSNESDDAAVIDGCSSCFDGTEPGSPTPRSPVVVSLEAMKTGGRPGLSIGLFA